MHKIFKGQQLNSNEKEVTDDNLAGIAIGKSPGLTLLKTPMKHSCTCEWTLVPVTPVTQRVAGGWYWDSKTTGSISTGDNF